MDELPRGEEKMQNHKNAIAVKILSRYLIIINSKWIGR